MEYIFHHISFVFDQKQHTYHFDRNDFVDGLLSKSIFDSICQYLTTVTQISLSADSIALDVNSMMRYLNDSSKLPIAFCLCTGFESSDISSQWSISEYSESKKDVERDLRPTPDAVAETSEE